MINGIWLNYYIEDWEPETNANFSKKYGVIFRENNFNPNEIGTYKEYFQLDSDLTQVNQLLKFIKFGFGQCMDHVCYDIRKGILTRDEAIQLVKKYDGKCDEKFIKQFCDYIEISVNDFWKNAEKFRGKMWIKNKNELINKYWNLF